MYIYIYKSGCPPGALVKASPFFVRKKNVFLLEDLAENPLGGLKTRDIRVCWLREVIFLGEIRLFQ